MKVFCPQDCVCTIDLLYLFCLQLDVFTLTFLHRFRFIGISWFELLRRTFDFLQTNVVVDLKKLDKVTGREWLSVLQQLGGPEGPSKPLQHVVVCRLG